MDHETRQALSNKAESYKVNVLEAELRTANNKIEQQSREVSNLKGRISNINYTLGRLIDVLTKAEMLQDDSNEIVLLRCQL